MRRAAQSNRPRLSLNYLPALTRGSRLEKSWWCRGAWGILWFDCLALERYSQAHFISYGGFKARRICILSSRLLPCLKLNALDYIDEAFHFSRCFDGAGIAYLLVRCPSVRAATLR